MRGMLWVSVFFSQHALGLLFEKQRGAGAELWLRVISVVTSPLRRLLGLRSSQGKPPLCPDCSGTRSIFTVTPTLTAPFIYFLFSQVKGHEEMKTQETNVSFTMRFILLLFQRTKEAKTSFNLGLLLCWPFPKVSGFTSLLWQEMTGQNVSMLTDWRQGLGRGRRGQTVMQRQSCDYCVY